MTGATNQNSAYYYSYDANNRVTGVAVTNLSSIYNIEYQYDIMGNRTMMTTPEGQNIKYSYNQNNQLTKIETDKGNYNFAYDSLNRRIKRTLPNDSYTNYAYDQLSRLTNITHKNAFNSTIDVFSYTYDNVGNRITKKDNHKSINYIYDQLYRLTKATPRSNNPLIQLLDDILKLNTESYSYDPVGNRQTGPKSTDSYTYDSGNEQLSSKGKMLLLNTNDQNEYDPNGNLIKKTETIQSKPATITNYTYDDENRLISVIVQIGDKIKQVTLAYDPFGRRISQALERDDFAISLTKPTYPQITNYVYDEQNIIAEYDQNNKQIATYIHGPNIDEPLSAEIRNNRIYYHADGLGSITALTNHMGMTVQKYDYDAFGNIKFTPFPIWIKQPYMFTGREYDTETGLYYYRARYYDAQAGRFITRDPVKFRGGINQYIYANNNPLRYLDSSGMWNWDVHFLMTFRIASQIPKLSCYAERIARNDQLVDDDERGPFWGGKKMRKLWHFPELGRVTHLLNIACWTCKAYDVGGALHVAQDAIAHAGYEDYHISTDIDNVAKRPYEAQLTYKYTYNDLILISGFCDEIF